MNTIKCKICSREFKSLKSLGSHSAQAHKISKEDYYLRHMNKPKGQCQICKSPTRFISLVAGYAVCCGNKCAATLINQDPNHREKISRATKIAMWRPEVRKNFMAAVQSPKSEATIKKLSNAAKQRFISDPSLKNRIYTHERNDKISSAKTEYWKIHPEEKSRVASIWKVWKARDEVGWRKHLMEASKKGFAKIFAPHGDTSLERKLYSMLEVEQIEYKKKHELDGKVYDAYLPSYNTLVEIDGDFWHRPSLDECKYDFQIESFHNDRLKENIAAKNNIRLVRIKEKSVPKTIREIL